MEPSSFAIGCAYLQAGLDAGLEVDDHEVLLLRSPRRRPHAQRTAAVRDPGVAALHGCPGQRAQIERGSSLITLKYTIEINIVGCGIGAG